MLIHSNGFNSFRVINRPMGLGSTYFLRHQSRRAWCASGSFSTCRDECCRIA